MSDTCKNNGGVLGTMKKDISDIRETCSKITIATYGDLYKGRYDALKLYQKDQIVMFNGELWESLFDDNTEPPLLSDRWKRNTLYAQFVKKNGTIYVVDHVDDMWLLLPSEVPCVYVRGAAVEEGRSGGLVFEWDATSTEEPNGETIISVDIQTSGRYVLQYNDTRISTVEGIATANESAIKQLELSQTAGVVGFLTQAELYAALEYPAGTRADVMQDTLDKNGHYIKIGDVDAGSWVRGTDDRDLILSDTSFLLRLNEKIEIDGINYLSSPDNISTITAGTSSHFTVPNVPTTITKVATTGSTTWHGFHYKISYDNLDDLDYGLMYNLKTLSGAAPTHFKILTAVGDWNSYNEPVDINESDLISGSINLKELIEASIYTDDYAAQNELYILVAKYTGDSAATDDIVSEWEFMPTQLTGQTVVATDVTEELREELTGLQIMPLRIMCYGDSLTAGSGGDGTTYPSVLNGLTSLPVLNQGVGGEQSQTITARAGVNPFVVDVVGGVIPASGEVEVSFRDAYGRAVKPLLQGGAVGNTLHGILGDIQGSITVKEVITEYVEATYNFTRSVDGDPITMDRPVSFYMDTALNLNPYSIFVIWIGQNDGVANEDRAMAEMRAMVREANRLGNEYIVISKPTSTDDFDEEMYLEFGDRFIPVRKYLREYGLADAGITATDQDNDDIANNYIPTSLRYDNVHFNSYGYTVLANLIYKRMKQLGFRGV